jgi:hypothetical protein
MRHTRLLVLLLALFGIACPGDWDEPLGPVHGGHIDSTLVGEWRCDAVGGPARLRLSIVPFDTDQYLMAMIDLTDQKEKTTYLRGFTTTVSGHDVMNLKELDDNPRDGAWTYARFRLPQDDRLTIEAVRKEPLDGVPADVESRREAIGGLFENPELWEDGYRCRPFKDEPPTK